MNARKLARSVPLQHLLACLRDAGRRGMTGAEVQAATKTLNVGTLVAELRANGFEIAWRLEGRTASGAKIGRYTLRENGEQLELL